MYKNIFQIEEFNDFVRNDSLPAFNLIRLPNDHTEGTEKGIVHYFFAADELKDVFAGFDIIEIKEDQKGEHYCVLAQK